ncbi:Crp/Fnr family transcriptional regulator [Leptolyngbya sp. FACHB-321]|uniref:Crp/Fnr family transcriptional regulator n=1 Tax=Leptolyngbya sp. FACHB-321 TaxID=2692807 RepID=UPI001688AE9C|nr:Crp/Fnr family transcriptional regulator [Leptolyngbya sp. FACHB-321]MBD2037369.1 Crp/Fnr family transcriptional regulator [Leptolyngbya sp. FACHB-321]
MSAPQTTPRSSNHLLAALPADVYQRLQPALEQVTLSIGQPIYEMGCPIDYVYFPEQALISLVSSLKDGATMEVGLVGQEGMAGLPVVLSGISHSQQAVVQVTGKAWRLPAEKLLTEFKRLEFLHSLLLRYMQAMLTQAAQGGACNRFHTTEERLARWLLLVSDSLGADTFPMTHASISKMLGVRRAGVTVAAGVLSQAGWVRYQRGCMTLVDRTGLEDFVCECYGVVHGAFAAVVSGS